MEIVLISILVIGIAIILGIIAIRWLKKPKVDLRCMNCDKATPINGVCPTCGYNERTQKLEN